jgi:hypothetical protein
VTEQPFLSFPYDGRYAVDKQSVTKSVGNIGVCWHHFFAIDILQICVCLNSYNHSLVPSCQSPGAGWLTSNGVSLFTIVFRNRLYCFSNEVPEGRSSVCHPFLFLIKTEKTQICMHTYVCMLNNFPRHSNLFSWYQPTPPDMVPTCPIELFWGSI